ncbi:hypothetical protein LAUMK191_02465 [Mycobacterium attenuatum]|nr:hypothetical protein LAUMK191_02465 [Mycobacterium attenuatum]
MTAHSDKEFAAPTYKGATRFTRSALVDHGPQETGEPVAILLRPRHAGTNTAADHKTVLAEAAHYLTYLVERGQQTVISLADPFARGWNLLGLAHLHVDYVLSTHPPVLATIKVACVVTGHIVAVIAAHDRALRLLPAGYQLTGQLTMMLVMVGYTFTGLYLLFGG